ncbi:MFS transporter [Sandaracinobacter neustonicus]|uniref:MFS transporter n=1 Tax=Sandaracinobacter neustonicus TaxID=1715348 RepID=A0A501XLN4_9SPHN|nr:MFS transporter [Sandaracinobacter neustonicus]TPE61548.1 MFS transporter [Sandaracinobacter neustonicus]
MRFAGRVFPEPISPLSRGARCLLARIPPDILDRMNRPGATVKAAGGLQPSLRPFVPFLAALWVAEMTGAFESAMILAAMKPLIEDFGSPVLVGWLITSYLIVGAASAAIVGRLGDLFGRRRILVVTLFIALIGSLISAYAINFPMLLAGRVLQGLTGAVLALCVGLVRENMPEPLVPMGIGLMISGASIGTAAGLVVGGWIADNFSWHGLFLASAAFCAATIVAIMAAVPASRRGVAGQPVDWLSGILFAPGVMLLLYYAGSIAAVGLLAPLPLLAGVTGLALILIWVWRSLSSAHPLLDVRQFRNREVLVANGITAVVSMSSLQLPVIFSVLLQAPLWTGLGLGLTAFAAGLAKLPSSILSTFAGPLSGWMTGRGGGRTTMIFGGLLASVGWLLLYFLHGSVLTVILVVCVISFGTTILFAVGPTIVAQAVTDDRTSEASGMLSVVRGLFQGIGAMMVTSLLAMDVVADTGSKATYPTEFAFQVTIAVLVLLNLLAMTIALWLPRNDRRQGF